MTGKNPAPYPQFSDDVTADSLARHLAVSAQHNQKALDADVLDKNAMKAFVYQWGLVFLLREIQERAGVAVADRLARNLWINWEDGSGLGEWLWEWLTEWGIDPKSISADAAGQAVDRA